MKHVYSAIAGLLLAAALPLSALAQIAPTDHGVGESRGIQDINNSGQIGSATFLDVEGGTNVIVHMRGVRAGRIEPLAILRGKRCEAIEPIIGWTLNPLIAGKSTTTIPAPLSKIFSGNYVVVVHADDHVSGHNVACGSLYH